MAPRVLVLGAGICGLSSAVCIQQACPLAQVEIVSEAFSPDTTGDVSAGFWEPYLLGKDNVERTTALGATTYRHMLNLANSSLAGTLKVQKISGYHLYKGCEMEKEQWEETVEGFRNLTSEELEQFPFADSGSFHTTVGMDVSPYMDWLMKRFKSQGGKVRQARVNNVEEIAAECDILINCSGISSRQLFQDDKLVPVRGQVWKIKAPWVKHFYFIHAENQDTSYVLPGIDFVTVGGTAQTGNWDANPNPRDGQQLWERAVRFLPMLTNVTPIESRAGLRPKRDNIRLEAENLNIGGRAFKVVHNYGHGGSGVSLHWGCALEVAAMVLEALGTEREEAKKIVSRL